VNQRLVAPSAPGGTIVPTPVLGTAIFLFSEVMLFCALISAYVVLRGDAAVWPPLDQPRLPVAATALNTGILLLSGYFMWRGVGALERGGSGALVRWLGLTLACGTAFVAIQGLEWISLVRYGLTTSSSIYGAIFYTIVGCHGLHVLAAIAVLAAVLIRALRGRHHAADQAGLSALGLYWAFVVAIWPPLYALVYLW